MNLFLNDILPLLNGTYSREEINQQLSGYSEKSINKGMSILFESGLIEKINSENETSTPNLEFMRDVGIPRELAISKLKNSRIIVFGLSGHGAHVIEALANEGVGLIKCVDMDETRNDDLYLFNNYVSENIGNSKEIALKTYLSDKYPKTKFQFSNEIDLSEKTVEKLVENCDYAISCVDKSNSSVFYWLNKAALKTGMVWCAASLNGINATIGPVTIPNKTSCYMCYKMRFVAAQNSYEDAMQYEKHLNKTKTNEMFRRSNIAANVSVVGNLLAFECLKHIIGFAPTPLAGRICIIDFLTLKTEFHDVLKRPDCPHCSDPSKKKLDQTRQWNNRSLKISNILEFQDKLVSPILGPIKGIFRVLKDPREPELPFIYGVSLSNANFDIDPEPESLACSGKGMSIEETMISSLGEGIERYCGNIYNENLTIEATESELESFLSPKKLVLFDETQYQEPNFPYQSYSPNNAMKWTKGYSINQNEDVFVPSIGVYLNFSTSKKTEHIFAPTSNGLAAGSNVTHAILGGLLEVIERDAFLLTWLAMIPMPLVKLDKVQNKQIKHIIQSYERRNIEIKVNALTLDSGITSYLATAVDVSGNGPAVTVGLSAHPDPETGILGAIKEIGQIRPHIIREMRKSDYISTMTKLKHRPNVFTIQDHEMFYTDVSNIIAFDFLHKNGNYIDINDLPTGPKENYVDQLEWCVDKLNRIDQNIIAIDLTSDDIIEFGLSAVRVILPDFQPMHFGFSERRLGGKRLFKIGGEMKKLNRKLKIGDLNPYPHPLG